MKDTRQEQTLKRHQHPPPASEQGKRQKQEKGHSQDTTNQSTSLPDASDELIERRIEAMNSCRYSARLSNSLQGTSQDRLMAILWNVAAIEPK